MNKSTILYLTRWYPSDTDPMLGLFVRNHAKAAVYAGYQVTVAYVSPAAFRSSGDNFRTSVVTEDRLTEVIVYYRNSGIFSPIIQLIAWVRAIRKALKVSGRPALIHAHILTRAGLFARLLSVYYKVPYLITEHWSRYFPENPGYKGGLRKMVTGWVVRNASAVTVVSERLYNSMVKSGLSFKTETLPNVVDTATFHPSQNKRSRFTFISITCFEEKSKNLKLLIKAASDIAVKGLDFDLVMVGDGVDKNLIKKYGKELGFNIIDSSPDDSKISERQSLMGRNIYFTGTLTPQDTAEILRQSHCLVLSSNYETFGIVVYEAMSSGLPVISTDVADLAQVIDKESGILIPVKDVDALGNAMETVMKNYGLYDAEKIRNQVIDKCSMKTVSGLIDSLYQKIIV